MAFARERKRRVKALELHAHLSSSVVVSVNMLKTEAASTGLPPPMSWVNDPSHTSETGKTPGSASTSIVQNTESDMPTKALPLAGA